METGNGMEKQHMQEVGGKRATSDGRGQPATKQGNQDITVSRCHLSSIIATILLITINNCLITTKILTLTRQLLLKKLSSRCMCVSTLLCLKKVWRSIFMLDWSILVLIALISDTYLQIHTYKYLPTNTYPALIWTNSFGNYLDWSTNTHIWKLFFKCCDGFVMHAPKVIMMKHTYFLKLM